MLYVLLLWFALNEKKNPRQNMNNNILPILFRENSIYTDHIYGHLIINI